jgi:hypothetical protein
MTTKATLERIADEDTLEKQQPLPFSIRDNFKISVGATCTPLPQNSRENQ